LAAGRGGPGAPLSWSSDVAEEDRQLTEQMKASPAIERIAQDPRYRALVSRRSRFTWLLTAIMLVVFFGYILLIAFNKPFLAQPIGNGTTSLGIPIGLGVILIGIALTGVYVRRANKDFDPVVRSILEDAEK
jgi:uncharacterized membrane protein (DUF485 family)